MPVNHNGVNAIRAGKAVWEPPASDPLRDAARRALASLDDLIANTTDPGVEALGARHELQTALIAAPAAAPSAPTDRTAFRDRIARALAEVTVGHKAFITVDVRAEYPRADAVLAVLPEPADRAAILREAADTVEAMNEGCGQRKPCASCDARTDAADALRDTARRVADEAQQPETQGEACGRTKSICGTEYPPCDLPDDHWQAYCRSADGKAYFLGAAKQPAAVSQPDGEA